MTTPDTTDIGTFIDGLADAATAAAGTPEPAIAGTFAMYPMDNGGLVLVADVKEGPMAGVHRHIMPPAMIRAVTAFAQGGAKIGALKALMGRGKQS